MTKFITYYNLCPIPEPKDFLGISPDKEDGNIITTLGKNIIIIIKISTQKQIRSWSVLEKLSSKVVYDRNTEKYVGVFANKFIRFWDENIADVNKCKKLKFQKSIADLVVKEKDTLILYYDGTCEPLHTAIESRKNNTQKISERFDLVNYLSFTNASIHSLANGSRILTYFERNSKSGDYNLVRVSLCEEKGSTKCFKLKRDISDVQVAGAAVIEGEGNPVLLTIWSDKRIFLLSLADDISPDRSPGNFVSMLTQLKVDTPLSVLGISKHFVAIYGANHGQEGASLLLYSTQYKVIKTKQFFKVYFNYSQLWSVDDQILLAMGQNLSVVKYRVLKEVLSELVGTQIGNDYQSAIEDDHINEEDFLEGCLQYSSDYGSYSESKRHEKFNIEEADGFSVAFENPRDFEKELNAFKQLTLHADVVQVDQPLDDIQISLMTNYNDSGFVCPEIQLIARQLEKAGASEYEITEKLLTVLIKANLVQDVGICLRRYNNISEKVLSKTLSFLLQKIESIDDKCETEHIPEINNTTGDAMEIDISKMKPLDNLDLLAEKYPQNCAPTDVIDILNILLTCSFDADTITMHIRQDIEYKHILLILQHLYNMLTTSQSLLIEERPSLSPTSTDYEMQILRWFGVFISANFQKLALCKNVELIELLYKWNELFQSYKREILELQEVAALLYNIVERKQSFKDKSCKWYTIEEVYLF